MKAATLSIGVCAKPVPFQSTPPVKAATVPLGTGTLSLYISIHAAREGGDSTVILFSPSAAGFQSTPPVKAATGTTKRVRGVAPISIHAAREGGDRYPQIVQNIYAISIHAAREGGDCGNE